MNALHKLSVAEIKAFGAAKGFDVSMALDEPLSFTRGFTFDGVANVRRRSVVCLA